MPTLSDANGRWGRGWKAFRRSRGMIFLPFTLSFLAGRLTNVNRGPTHDWLPMAQKFAVFIGALYLVFPFWFQMLVARNPEVYRPRGRNPEEVTLTVATACSIMPTMLAFFLWIAGGPAQHVYYASAFSVVGSFYWAWRYRH